MGEQGKEGEKAFGEGKCLIFISRRAGKRWEKQQKGSGWQACGSLLRL